MNGTPVLTAITPVLGAARAIKRSKSTWYEMTNPKSKRYDADLPVPFKIGRNAFVVTAELEEYIQKKIGVVRENVHAGKVAHGEGRSWEEHSVIAPRSVETK